MILWSLWIIAAAAVITLRTLANWLQQRAYDNAAWTDTSTVSVIIPVLNEERALGATVQWLRSNLSPQPLEVIVVDGGSSDGTVAAALCSGCAAVISAPKGRARQMNAGARAASGDALCFVHADSCPPASLVHVIRATLAATGTVAGGFRTLITCSTCPPSSRGPLQLLRFMTWHHFFKSYYIPLLARPQMLLRGGLCLFGDQSIFCRSSDFWAVGGYDESLAIMEDVDLVIRLHEAGPASDHDPSAASPQLPRGQDMAAANGHSAQVAASLQLPDGQPAPAGNDHGAPACRHRGNRSQATCDVEDTDSYSQPRSGLAEPLVDPLPSETADGGQLSAIPCQPGATPCQSGTTLRPAEAAQCHVLRSNDNSRGIRQRAASSQAAAAAAATAIAPQPETAPAAQTVSAVAQRKAAPAAKATTAMAVVKAVAAAAKAATAAVARSRRKGKIRQVLWPPAVTSGRRLEPLGNLRATRIHFTIGLSWYWGVSRQTLSDMCHRMYDNSYR